MADSDKTEMQDAADQPPAGDARRRREPPTIELDASDVTSETTPPEAGETAAAEPAAEHEPPQPSPSQKRSAGAGRAGVIGALCGGGAAAAVLGAAWLAGWPPAPATPPTQAVSVPAIDTDATDALAARLSSLEADVRMARAAAPATDADGGGIIKRLDAVDHSLSAQREAMETQRTHADKLASSMEALQSEIAAIKATPRDGNIAAPDLSPINERIAQVEQTARAALAQADRPAPAATNDDKPLRNAIAAVMLTNAVQHGEPYAALLTAAKKLTNDATMLAPLDQFATSGVPTPDALRADLLALLPKLAPPAPAAETASAAPSSDATLLDRLQTSAMRLVHIRRAERAEPETGAAARLAAAARRGDLAAARQELTALPPAERATAQPWLTQLEARDAALRAARAHAAAATAALAPSTP